MKLGTLAYEKTEVSMSHQEGLPGASTASDMGDTCLLSFDIHLRSSSMFHVKLRSPAWFLSKVIF